MPTSDPDLSVLQALAEEATPGPWHLVDCWFSSTDDCDGIFGSTFFAGVDTDFVLALRNAADWLIERARRADELEREPYDLREELDETAHFLDVYKNQVRGDT